LIGWSVIGYEGIGHLGHFGTWCPGASVPKTITDH